MLLRTDLWEALLFENCRHPRASPTEISCVPSFGNPILLVPSNGRFKYIGDERRSERRGGGGRKGGKEGRLEKWLVKADDFISPSPNPSVFNPISHHGLVPVLARYSVWYSGM